MVSLGIEQLVASPPEWLAGSRIGLLCNQASTDRNLKHSKDLVYKYFPGQLSCLFSPQHGFFSDKQDNMIESSHSTDGATGVKIFSLYGEQRKPDKFMFDQLDVLLVDLMDVGTRVYTFIYTLAYCLEAAAEFSKKVVVLDRPNPIGGDNIEGNILKDDCRSFVGLYQIPMRHGLTIGELARFINTTTDIGADLEVISMSGWQRDMLFEDTGLPWVFPSPNIPTPTTALVYPGQVVWEGTNISEGRGTTLPFELFGAPFFKHDEITDLVGNIPGLVLRSVVFEPTSNKWAGQPCNGFQIHITDAEIFKPYFLSISLLQAVMKLYPVAFQYKKPPYEYEYERLPMDLIIGDSSLRQAIEGDRSIKGLEEEWLLDLQQFNRLRKQFLIY